MRFSSIIRKIILKYKATSESYIEHLRMGGAKIGDDVTIFSPNHTYIDEQFLWMLEIGSHVNITIGCHILNHDYSWAVGKVKYGEVCGGVAPVHIGNNVFIGVNSIILMGTTIGNNVIIGAGSVVKGNVPDDTVVAGNPARVICRIDEYWEKRKNKQYAEAKVIVQNYRKRFGKDPEKNKLPAYFFLWEDKEKIDDPIILQRMKLCGNYEETYKAFITSEAMFRSYDEFLGSIE